jgi:hypothetical protein
MLQASRRHDGPAFCEPPNRFRDAQQNGEFE